MPRHKSTTPTRSRQDRDTSSKEVRLEELHVPRRKSTIPTRRTRQDGGTPSKRVRLQELLGDAALNPEITGGRITTLSDALHLRSADLTKQLMKEGSKYLKNFVRNPEVKRTIEDMCRISKAVKEEGSFLQKIEDYVVGYFEALMKYRTKQYEQDKEDETRNGIRHPLKTKDREVILFRCLRNRFGWEPKFPFHAKEGHKDLRNKLLEKIPVFSTWGCNNASKYPRVLPNGTLKEILHLGEKVSAELDTGRGEVERSGEKELLSLLCCPPLSMLRRCEGFQAHRLIPTSLLDYQYFWHSHILDQVRGELYNFTHDTKNDNLLSWDTQNRDEGTTNVLRVNEVVRNGYSHLVSLGLCNRYDSSSYQRGRSREVRPKDIVLMRFISEDERNTWRSFDYANGMESKCSWALVKSVEEKDWSVLVDMDCLERTKYVVAMMQRVASAVMFLRELEVVNTAKRMDRGVIFSLLQPEMMDPSMFRLAKSDEWPGKQVQKMIDWVNGDFSGLTGGQQKLCNIFMRHLCFASTRQMTKSTRIIAVQGPPGCGKTEAIVRVLESMLHIQSFKPKILVCAPSNAATDGLAKAILKMLKNPKCKCSTHVWTPAKVVRLSTSASEDEDVQDISIDRKALATIGGGSSFPRSSFQESLWRRKLFCVRDDEVQIYVSTLGSVRQQLMKESGVEFAGAIIDEAGQCRELDVLHALVPTSWGKKPPPFVVLVGDPQQLPATVNWAVHEEEREVWERSLLERIMYSRQRIQKDTVLLDEQFRMHPAIASFPNRSFYNGKIRNSELVRTSSKYTKGFHFDREGRFGPLTFIDTSGICAFEQRGNVSKSNKAEAELILKLIETLVLLYRPSNNDSGRISVISPYRGQVNEVRLMKQNSEVLRKEEVDVETVDSMQGAERDIVFLSLVRSNIYQDVGFVKDIRRLNVAMTRAKYSLIMLGNYHTLGRSKDWKSCIEFIKKSSETSPDYKFIELREDENIGYLKAFLPESFRRYTLTGSPI